jgi:transcription elongation GreA/GreB family factor
MIRRRNKDRIKVKVTLRVTDTGGTLTTTVVGPTEADIDYDIISHGIRIESEEATTYV